MKYRKFERTLLGSSAGCLLSTLLLFGLPSQATAGSNCTAISSTAFNCVDDVVTPNPVATGTFSSGALLTSDIESALNISTSGSLNVVISGQLNANASDQFGTFAVHLVSGGALTYTNNGTTLGTTTSWLLNTYLRSDESIVAHTGNVTASGHRVTGVFSEVVNGNITLVGGNTTVSGMWSRGLWSDAFGTGNNVTDTGTVVAEGQYSRGVIARATRAPEGCALDALGQSTTVNVTGDVSAEYVGIITLSCGDSLVNVLAGNTVSVSGTEGAAIANIANGTADAIIDGTVMAATVADRALLIRAGASATSIGGTGLLSGTFFGDEGADTITISSGGTWVSAGTSDFATGSDAIINGGLVNVASGTFDGLEQLTNSGTLSITGGSLTVTGSETFINNGTIAVAAGETLITIDSPLVNNGTFNMQNGQAGDVLTIANDYVAGSGATVWIDVSETACDLFVVNGNSSGTTMVMVNAAARIQSNGMLIATIDPNTANFAPESLAMKFLLSNRFASRLIDLDFKQVGSNLYITALPNVIAYRPIMISNVSRDLWYESADVTSGNVGSRQRVVNPRASKRMSIWGQVYASDGNDGNRSTLTAFANDVKIDTRLRTKRKGIQTGIDAPLGGRFKAGLTGGYGRANADFNGYDGGIKAEGWNIGAYVQVGGASGFYANALIKYDENNLELSDQAFSVASVDPGAASFGGQAQMGYRWNAANVRFDVGSSLSLVKTSVDDFITEGIDFAFRPANSVRGSLDVQASLSDRKLEPFVSARMFYEFDGDSNLTLQSGDEADRVESNGQRTWLKMEAGIGGQESSSPILSGWAELGDVEGFGFRAGWRF